MWEEVVVAYFEVSSRHLPGGAERNFEIFQPEESITPPRFEPHTFQKKV
jgi:hypothetical protein